jgi:hypothetical protein
VSSPAICLSVYQIAAVLRGVDGARQFVERELATRCIGWQNQPTTVANLVTFNRRHFPADRLPALKGVSPKEFLNVLKSLVP